MSHHRIEYVSRISQASSIFSIGICQLFFLTFCLLMLTFCGCDSKPEEEYSSQSRAKAVENNNTPKDNQEMLSGRPDSRDTVETRENPATKSAPRSTSRTNSQKAKVTRGSRVIDIRKQDYCNCCESPQENVRYWVTTFEMSIGSFQAGDKLHYGLCSMCQKYCFYPHRNRCSLRASVERK